MWYQSLYEYENHYQEKYKPVLELWTVEMLNTSKSRIEHGPTAGCNLGLQDHHVLFGLG